MARKSSASRSERECALQPEELRWSIDARKLHFETTDEVEPIVGVVGQDRAMEALRFGLEINAPGQNIFVRGLIGTGRLTLIHRLLEEIRPACPLAPDRCYVHNFDEPDHPRLLTLPRGWGPRFQQEVEHLIDFIRDDLGPALSSDQMRARQSAIEETAREEILAITDPFDQELRAANLYMTTVDVGPTSVHALMPVINGQTISPEQFEQLRSSGKLGQEAVEEIRSRIQKYSKRLEEVSEAVQEVRQRLRTATQQLFEREIRALMKAAVRDILNALDDEQVHDFIGRLIDDVISRFPKAFQEGYAFTRLYQVNLLMGHEVADPCPIIVENNPTVQNLVGTIERTLGPGNRMVSDHMSIHAGSLLRADGGYLIVDVRELLVEPGAWRVLIRTLKSERLEFGPSDFASFWGAPSIKPDPVELNVKIILLGDSVLYQALDTYDPDFPHLFKVLADFDTYIPRDSGVSQYAGVLARILKEQNLLPFDREAVARLVEHGARIAARRGRLTTRFGRLVDIALEAVFLAEREPADTVRGRHVVEAVRRSKDRANLPALRFREMVEEGTLHIRTGGRVVGQVNGLAVVQAGPLTYGFPARITATIGAGTAGAINIEREAQLSGAIHTKGFYILGGLLRYLLRTDHPLAFDASVAFEQSYGGIDGDSASGAEICCLLSALTDVALRQDIAMTGAIDQVGHILPVGACNEKIEGFFDICRDLKLTGSQGVIIPRANVGDLMLREDVVEACREGTFRIWGVSTIHQALEILTGSPAGERQKDGFYPAGTLLALAMDRARDFWRMAATPDMGGETDITFTEDESGEADAAADRS